MGWVMIFSIIRKCGFKLSVMWEYKNIFTVNWALAFQQCWELIFEYPMGLTKYILCELGLRYFPSSMISELFTCEMGMGLITRQMELLRP